jgi:hypothetical protein
MSRYMLNDEDAINDVNPFVAHDFSLPGGVRQTGGFDDFQEVTPSTGIPAARKSVFCETGLCAKEKEPCRLGRGVHPRRNIDYGFTRQRKPPVVGVSNRSIPWGWILVAVLLIVLALLYARR